MLAVKKVEISKYFKIGNEDVGPITFTDTCGIGEYRLGVEDELKKVLLRDSDIAVAVAKVPVDVTTIDQLSSFHHRITPVLYNQDPGKWVYYLINKKANIDSGRAMQFKSNIETSLGKNGLYLPSVNYQIVQASAQDEIYNFILTSILKPVADNIKNVDSILFSKIKKDSEDAINEYTKIRKLIYSLNIPDFNAYKEKKTKINNEIFGNIRHGLQDLINEISNPEDFADEDLVLLTEEIDAIKDSPDGFDLVHLFYPKDLDVLWEKEKTTEEDVNSFITEKKTSIISILSIPINGQRNYKGDELSVLQMYRQRLLEDFYKRLESINVEHANQSMEKIIKRIGDVFMIKGNLSLNALDAPDNSTFFNAIITYSRREGLSKLTNFFLQIRDAQLPYMNSFLEKAQKSILPDAKFRITLNYSNDGRDIAEQFYEVLYTIDKNVKTGLRTYFEREKLVEAIIQHYFSMVGMIQSDLLKPLDKDGATNEIYEDFISLYMKLYYKIFDSSDLEKKERGVQVWNTFRSIVF